MVIIGKLAESSDNSALIVAVIALTGTVLGILFNSFNTKNIIKADVVSKERIDWIKKEKEYLTNYISLATYMYNYYQISEQIGKIEHFKMFSKEFLQFRNLRNTLLISLGPDDDEGEFNNSNFIILINELFELAENTISEKITDEKKTAVTDKADDLVKFSRNYFKNEWNKIKKNK